MGARVTPSDNRLTDAAPDVARIRHQVADVVRRDRGRLLRFVHAKLSGASDLDAEDVVADTVLRLIERADLLTEVENVTAYLFRALANGVIDRIRRRRELTPLPEEVEDPALGPEQTLEQTQLRRRLRAALDRLPPAQRAVWIAVEIEGVPFRELAAQWNEPIGTLLSRKNRATKSLRQWLAEDAT
ncbi:RNA polymerase sigma factor [Rhodopseudomonas palustris]|uniref:Sigma-24 (FecI-like) n=1 Tax=Rhodopseudomonas palustris (strain BisB18) TaxID=316056 RepID=Q210R0_RHOPB